MVIASRTRCTGHVTRMSRKAKVLTSRRTDCDNTKGQAAIRSLT